uniref:Uncharacterized protein n=1 Tax=Opuntia streptacantha TaxID=393608 RepID=A0A7C8YLH3_OPUST
MACTSLAPDLCFSIVLSASPCLDDMFLTCSMQELSSDCPSLSDFFLLLLFFLFLFSVLSTTLSVSLSFSSMLFATLSSSISIDMLPSPSEPLPSSESHTRSEHVPFFLLFLIFLFSVSSTFEKEQMPVPDESTTEGIPLKKRLSPSSSSLNFPSFTFSFLANLLSITKSSSHKALPFVSISKYSSNFVFFPLAFLSSFLDILRKATGSAITCDAPNPTFATGHG